METQFLRNVAIIAHVDHGKTTLVDRLLYQSGMFRKEELDKLVGGQNQLIMDSNPIERERGITIFSKNCAVRYNSLDGQEYKINIIDTPGHADFGGEVERVLKMADGVLLLVDAYEGPMPQTRFVLQKALRCGLRPIVVVSKIDRADARPHEVVTEVFDLLVELDADHAALDFPVIYASARDGWGSTDLHQKKNDLRDLFEAIIKHVPPPVASPDETLQMLVTTLDYSDYVGRIGIGRVFAGELRTNQMVTVINHRRGPSKQKVLQLFQFDGLGRKTTDVVGAGDICAVVGLEAVDIGDTISDLENPKALPALEVDEPTLRMNFYVNDSPFSGQSGTYNTSRQIKERLEKELQSNVALQVTPGASSDEFCVSGRGLMHLGILLENMRREGFEIAAGNPRVIFKTINGEQYEPIENLVVDCPAEYQSSVLSLIGNRRAEMIRMDVKNVEGGFVHMEFSIPSRGLIGLKTRMLNATKGNAVMHHTFLEYQPMRGPIPKRQSGVLIASDTGQVRAYALDALYDRGMFVVKPGDQVYEGQIVGEHCKDNDIEVNATREKAKSNMRASNKDDAAKVRPMREMSMEACLEYIQEDELVEITPDAIRMRKRILSKMNRRLDQRNREGA